MNLFLREIVTIITDSTIMANAIKKLELFEFRRLIFIQKEVLCRLSVFFSLSLLYPLIHIQDKILSDSSPFLVWQTFWSNFYFKINLISYVQFLFHFDIYIFCIRISQQLNTNSIDCTYKSKWNFVSNPVSHAFLYRIWEFQI